MRRIRWAVLLVLCLSGIAWAQADDPATLYQVIGQQQVQIAKLQGSLRMAVQIIAASSDTATVNQAKRVGLLR